MMVLLFGVWIRNGFIVFVKLIWMFVFLSIFSVFIIYFGLNEIFNFLLLIWLVSIVLIIFLIFGEFDEILSEFVGLVESFIMLLWFFFVNKEVWFIVCKNFFVFMMIFVLFFCGIKLVVFG